MALQPKNDVDFKDRISTVDSKGKRKWIYALKPEGTWYNYRSYLSYFYLIVFFVLPFLSINGSPILMFNFPKAEFVIFTVVFTPQDFVMFGLAMLTFIFIIIVFTMIYGRLFCGWVCPQTVFLEMVFRRIEYLIEGNANIQKLNDSKPFNLERGIRKILKHLVFLFVSFLISNTFLLYIIGKDEWLTLISDPLKYHIIGLISILVFTLVFYTVFAFVREIVCTVVCPYGRLQGVLVDNNTLAVSYDSRRGEPRTKHKLDDQQGDCIDCNLCVAVCPTGIDIRNGSSQLECTQCTACIDACNMMMLKVKRQPDLIKYASVNNIETNKNFNFTPRIKVFSGILVALVALFVYILATRTQIDSVVLKVPGQILQTNQDGSVSNFYSLKLTNKGKKTIPISLSMEDGIGTIEFVGQKIDSIAGGTKLDCLFFVRLEKNQIKEHKRKLELLIKSKDKILARKDLIFVEFL
ncbi:MAG: cytochrome c oxidase accessory protein CcoG [Saprospiraceae bacterium]|nr:cytochrome c oxidase accessory protein CcoG [Candidatus Vicinibacter affinis]